MILIGGVRFFERQRRMPKLQEVGLCMPLRNYTSGRVGDGQMRAPADLRQYRCTPSLSMTAAQTRLKSSMRDAEPWSG